jgi:hypothetical protein
MKKLLLGSLAMIFLSITVSIINVSCQEEATAQTNNTYILPPATTAILGGVIPDGVTINVEPNGRISAAGNSTIASTTRLGGVIPDGTSITVDANGKISATQNNNGVQILGKMLYNRFDRANNIPDGLWIANWDGSGQTKVNIPNDIRVSYPKLSTDHKLIFFQGYTANNWSLYSCNLDGSNLKRIIDGGLNQYEYEFVEVY